MIENPYKVLDLSHGASAAEAKRAYRRLAMRWHPDRNPSHEAEARFKRIKAAYELILDPERLAAWMKAHGHQAPASEPEPEPEAAPSPAPEAAPDRPRNEDLVQTVSLSLEEAALGCATLVTLTTARDCEHCAGTGRVTYAHSRACRSCQGIGRIRTPEGTEECGACAGKGFVRKAECSACEGSGRVEAQRNLEVRIPPGLLPGERVRLAGQGQRASATHAAGDLYLEVALRPHDLFTLVGRDLHCRVPVSILVLMAGGSVTIPLLAGQRPLKLKPYPAHGLAYRLKGEGFPGKGGKGGGDLLIELVPEFPLHLGADEQALLRQLQARIEANLALHAPNLRDWQDRLAARAPD